jgi:hypothetical protein
VQPEEFQRDVVRLQYRLKMMYSHLLKPTGVFAQYWDLTTTIALLFTTFVTPFEVSMRVDIASQPTPTPPHPTPPHPTPPHHP